MFSTKKAKNTVSEILADFQLKVTELRQLAERKAEEVQTTQIQITTLETAKASAQAEAVKANKAASKIEKFLEDQAEDLKRNPDQC